MSQATMTLATEAPAPARCPVRWARSARPRSLWSNAWRQFRATSWP